MKKLLILVIIPFALLIANNGVVVTQSNFNQVTLSVNLSALSINQQELEGKTFADLSFPESDIPTQVGAPLLPIIRELIEIPFGADVSINAEVIKSDYLYPQNRVLPMQASESKSGTKPPFVMNEVYYNQDEFVTYQQDAEKSNVRARIAMIGEIRGHRIALVEIYPVAYNAKQNVIEYASVMKVNLVFTNSNLLLTEQKRNDFYSKPYDMMLQGMIKNYDSYVLYPPPEIPVGYLIIVPDEWVSNIAPLVEWRTRKGYSVFVRTLTQTGGGTTSAVKNYILQAYNTWPVRPTYVLLVGDIDKIGYWTGSGTDNPPTDLNYSLMTTPDYLPDIDLSRASVANAAQLDSLVQKTIKYEKNQWFNGTDWTNRALFIASADGSYHGVAEGTHRYCMARMRRLGYDVICDSIFTYYTTGAAALVTSILNGVGRAWLSFSGHGGETGWADPGISYPTTTIHALTNVDKVPLVGSYCCLTGNFAYSSECGAEAWIRSGYRGAIANYASSVTSYWPNDDTLQRRVFDAALDSSFYWAMGMLNRGKLAYFRQWGDVSFTRRYFEEYNMLGDGAIDIYWSVPAAISVTYPVVIPLGLYNIPVSVTKNGMPVYNALVCAMVKSDTSRRAMAYTDISGQVVLPLTTVAPDSVYITVTGHNLAPHMGGTMALATSGAYVMYLRNQILDPTPGGNNNGIVNPGEAVEMRVWLKNFGSSTANNVRAWLRTTDANIAITDSFKTLGTILSNDSAYTANGFHFTVAPSCTNGYNLNFSIAIRDANDSLWQSNVTVPVAQCILTHVSTLVDDASGNNNGIINRGETVNLIATIRNIGGSTADNITSVLISSTPGITIIDGSGSFGSIAPNSVGANTADPYTINADSTIVPGTIAQFRIVVTSGVYIDTLQFGLPIEIYIVDFEANDGGYTADPSSGGWEWGVASAGPSTAHSGTKLWGTVLSGQYANSANYILQSPEFTASTNSPQLKFWHWYNMENTYDGGNLKISTNNGANWTLVRPEGGYPGQVGTTNAAIPGESCYTDINESWNEAVFNLPVMSGQRFLVRWCFGSDGSVQRNGWYIDDVTGLGFAVLPPPNNDVGVSEIIYPSATHRVNTLMLPVARVKNYGVMTQTNFPVICSIFGTGNALRYTNTQTVASLATGETTRVNFTGWTPTVTEQCNVRMRTNLPADQVPANDMMSISTEISLMYIAEGFNDAAFPPNGWQRTIIQGTYNWDRKTSNTYPTCAPYEGEAMASYQSFSASSGSSARLISPPISLGLTPTSCSLKFFMYHDPGYTTSPDSIKVEYSLDGTNFTRVTAVRRYEATSVWTEHSVYLGTLSGTIYIGLLAYSGYGNNMNVDYVRLTGLSGIEEGTPTNMIVTTLNAPKPNPVTNGLARISFSIGEPSRVSLKIYDASGRVIKTLVNSQLERGVYNLTWNGRDDNNRTVAEGIYFYTMETSGQNFTKKMIFTR